MTIKDLVPHFGHGRSQAPVRRGEWDPFRDFQREINRLFDDFFSDTLAPRGAERGLAPGLFSPRVDVAETDKDVTVSAELPGLDEKDLTVELGDAAVTIRGERQEEKEEKGRQWRCREQCYGAFHRVVQLPASVDGTKARARFKKGVLTITVPKREAAQDRRRSITIETE